MLDANRPKHTVHFVAYDQQCQLASDIIDTL